MAITCTNKADGGTATDGTSIGTSSITLTSGVLYYLVAASRMASEPAAPTCTGWTQLVTAPALSSRRITIFGRVGDGSTGAHTIDWGAVTQLDMAYSVEEWGTDVDESDSVVQTKAASAPNTSTPGVDFDDAFADATNNATYLAAWHTYAASMTPDGSLSELGEYVGANVLTTSWLLGEDQTPSMTAGGNGAWVAVGVEVKAAAAASGLSIPIAMNYYAQSN